MVMPNLSHVFEITGKALPYSELSDNQLFMIEEEQMNYYWRTAKKNWQPYKSSIVFRKESPTHAQRYMTVTPLPPELVIDPSLICYPVKFIG